MQVTWPDGTPKSVGNGFDWNTGKPSIFLQDRFWKTSHLLSKVSTETVQRNREAGNDNSTIYGLSKQMSDLQVSFYGRFNVHIANQAESARTNAIRNST